MQTPGVGRGTAGESNASDRTPRIESSESNVLRLRVSNPPFSNRESRIRNFGLDGSSRKVRVERFGIENWKNDLLVAC